MNLALTPSPAPTPPLWPSEWAGVGTVVLAAVTFLAILSTIVITRHERKLAEARLREERQLAQEQEQLAEARSVEVLGARTRPDESDSRSRPVALVINRGRGTITKIDPSFSDGHNTSFVHDRQSYAERGDLSHDLRNDVTDVVSYVGMLQPGGRMRALGELMSHRELRQIFPVVRWNDRWGTRWEHRKGEVRQIEEREDWKP